LGASANHYIFSTGVDVAGGEKIFSSIQSSP